MRAEYGCNKQMRKLGQNKAIATLVSGAKIRYTWPCGTYRTKDHSLGPVAKRFGPDGARFLVGYWNRGGGVTVDCPKHGRNCNKGDNQPWQPQQHLPNASD